ncbi:hypothetical protein DVR12_22475, partial [Chitinophaga silvatica]
TANPTYAVANILKKITFPTGGYRQFQVSSFIWHSSDNYDWEIDPAGKQTTYFADFLGRLYQVSDFKNYIRKNIAYKIAGTN